MSLQGPNLWNDSEYRPPTGDLPHSMLAFARQPGRFLPDNQFGFKVTDANWILPFPSYLAQETDTPLPVFHQENSDLLHFLTPQPIAYGMTMDVDLADQRITQVSETGVPLQGGPAIDPATWNYDGFNNPLVGVPPGFQLPEMRGNAYEYGRQVTQNLQPQGGAGSVGNGGGNGGGGVGGGGAGGVGNASVQPSSPKRSRRNSAPAAPSFLSQAGGDYLTNTVQNIASTAQLNTSTGVFGASKNLLPRNTTSANASSTAPLAENFFKGVANVLKTNQPAISAILQSGINLISDLFQRFDTSDTNPPQTDMARFDRLADLIDVVYPYLTPFKPSGDLDVDIDALDQRIKDQEMFTTELAKRVPSQFVSADYSDFPQTLQLVKSGVKEYYRMKNAQDEKFTPAFSDVEISEYVKDWVLKFGGSLDPEPYLGYSLINMRDSLPELQTLQQNLRDQRTPSSQSKREDLMSIKHSQGTIRIPFPTTYQTEEEKKIANNNIQPLQDLLFTDFFNKTWQKTVVDKGVKMVWDEDFEPGPNSIPALLQGAFYTRMSGILQRPNPIMRIAIATFARFVDIPQVGESIMEGGEEGREFLKKITQIGGGLADVGLSSKIFSDTQQIANFTVNDDWYNTLRSFLDHVNLNSGQTVLLQDGSTQIQLTQSQAEKTQQLLALVADKDPRLAKSLEEFWLKKRSIEPITTQLNSTPSI